MADPEVCIYFFDGEGIREVAYADTEHYLVTQDFLGDHQRSLSVLFTEDQEDVPN